MDSYNMHSFHVVFVRIICIIICGLYASYPSKYNFLVYFTDAKFKYKDFMLPTKATQLVSGCVKTQTRPFYSAPDMRFCSHLLSS